MKTTISVLLSLAMAFAMGCTQQRNSAQTGGTAATSNVSGIKAESFDRLKDSAKVLDELMNTPDSTIPANILENAKCVAVVPSMIKGGFVFGGQHGRGVATCRTANGWSSPAFFTITGGSWGAQIGAEAVDLVMVIANDEGMKNLLSANWELGGAASVAAGPVGRQAQASTSATMQSQILVYSRTRGLFAGLTLQGAHIAQDQESSDAFYGRNVAFSDVLNGKVRAPSAAGPFLTAVRRNFRKAKVVS